MKGGVLNTNKKNKIEEFARGLSQRERKYVNTRQAQQAQFYTMKGETKSFPTFPIASVSNIYIDVKKWLNADDVKLFIKDTETPLNDDYILEAGKEYFVLPRVLPVDIELTQASEKGDIKQVTDLLDKGAQPNAKDKQGRTPLQLAGRSGHVAVMRLLLDKGADVDGKGVLNMPPLHWAIMNAHVRILPVQLLLDNGADVSAVDEKGNTSLLYASEYGYDEVVTLLLDKGADVNAVNMYGDTPLHWASARGYENVATLLLAAGADVNAVNGSNMTPLEMATRYRKNAVANLIREHVAKQSN